MMIILKRNGGVVTMMMMMIMVFVISYNYYYNDKVILSYYQLPHVVSMNGHQTSVSDFSRHHEGVGRQLKKRGL